MFYSSFKHSPAITRWLAAVWLLVMLALAWHQWQFWRAPALTTDVFAALPQDKQSAFADRALQQLAQDNERRVVVLIGSPDWAQTQQTAKAFEAAMTSESSPFTAVASPMRLDALLGFYAPWRDALLTPEQRQLLAQSPDNALADRALQRLYGVGQMQPSSWLQDPLGLWPTWWGERLQQSPVRQSDGMLQVQDPASGMQYALLLYETQDAAFRFDGERTWSLALERAKAAATEHMRSLVGHEAQAPVQWHMAGIPLFAEEGAAQGHEEMNSIGWGSLIAVVLLALFAFMAIRPMLLVALSLGVGCAAGLSATVLVFGHVHVLTLVFGASLVGVAEDFGIHYFASRLNEADPKKNTAFTRWALMRHLLPGLSIALLTSVIAYAVLAIVPFPGLRQMALFSAVGLAAAFATVVCWFPLLDESTLKQGAFARRMAQSIRYWPVIRNRYLPLFLVLVLGFCAVGIGRIQINDNLRALQPAAPELMQDQQAVQQILHMPSMVQFFLVTGPSPQAVLEREEALSAYIEARNHEAAATSASDALPLRLQALSQWIPSLARQRENRQLSAQAETRTLASVSAQLGEDLTRPAFDTAGVTLEQWLASPAASLMHSQWLNQLKDGQFASVVLVQTSGRALGAADLAAIAQAQSEGLLAGVQWQDRIQDLSQLLQDFRLEMSWLLILGHAIVLLALMWRFGRHAWRAWLPCALASLLTVAILGYAGQTFQLFNVLALLLLLGMGVDYGIFLLEHQGDEEGNAWLAILVGGSSTILSFGLLGLSSTPALRAFGLTLLIGLPLVVVLAPMLRRTPETSAP